MFAELDLPMLSRLPVGDLSTVIKGASARAVKRE